MRIAGFITLLLASLITACAPVAYSDLSDPGISVPEAGAEIINASYNENNVIAVFPAITGARSYGYSFDNSNILAGNTEFSDGIYTMSFPKPAGFSESDSFSLYASPSRNPSDGNPGWVWFADVTGAGYEAVDINSVAPEGYVSERTENSVTIAFVNQPGEMEYKAVVPGVGEVEGSGSEITITGLSTDASYSIAIYHRYKGHGEYGDKSSVITVGSYDSDEVLRISSSRKAITVSQLPAVAGELSIVNDATGAVLVSATTEGENSHTFTEEDITLFDTGIFHAVFRSNGSEVVSGNIPYTAELTVESYDVMRQHYVAYIPAPEGIDTTVFSIALAGVPTAECNVEWIDGNAVVTVSGLSSLTAYTGSITSGDETYPLSFTTEGFAGRYRFLDGTAEGKYEVGEFVVDVEKAAEGSSTRYYFYASSEDPHSTADQGRLRISPLIDSSLEEVPEGDIDYNGSEYYQKAYRWNNTKWNAADGAEVKSWLIKSYSPSGDSYVSIVSSTASMFGLTTSAETTTRFMLEEDEDGNASLIFFNKITGGAFASVGNNMIRKNPNPDTARFGEDAPFTFELGLEETV